MIRRRWPEWWDWELELSLPLFKRMPDRGFSELDLRVMLIQRGQVLQFKPVPCNKLYPEIYAYAHYHRYDA